MPSNVVRMAKITAQSNGILIGNSLDNVLFPNDCNYPNGKGSGFNNPVNISAGGSLWGHAKA